jgi:hypothetical protein
MRLALRSGLVEQGDVEEVREATRDAFKQVAETAGLAPPVLDDLLWERAARTPTCSALGRRSDRAAPPRGVVFY